jgi:hypothetical protein
VAPALVVHAALHGNASAHGFSPASARLASALKDHRRKTASSECTLVSMNASMSETATSGSLHGEQLPPNDSYANGRERAGVVAFIVVAIAATVAWLGLLTWLIVLLIRSVF